MAVTNHAEGTRKLELKKRINTERLNEEVNSYGKRIGDMA